MAKAFAADTSDESFLPSSLYHIFHSSKRQVQPGRNFLLRDMRIALWDKRGPFCICFYCICRRARVDLRRVSRRHGRVTAHASRNSTHDGEGEGMRGLGMGFHRVNYTIFAAGRVGFRGRFPWPRKVSVVRREQIRVLNQNRRGLSTFQLFNRRSPPGSAQPFNFSTSQVPRKLPRSSVTFIQAYTVKHILKGPFCLFGRLSRPYAESLF